MEFTLMSRIALLLVALAGLLLCSEVAVAAPQTTKTCEVLSQAAASALFGSPLDPPRGTFPSCAYFGAGGDDKKGLIVAVIEIPHVDMAAMYKQLLHADPTSRVEPVSGVGEQANFVITSDGTIGLQVLYHNNIVQIGASNSPNPNIKAAIVQAMRQILQKI
jgi:hypothetical protein